VRLGNRNSVELHGEYRGVHDAGRELPVSWARGPSEEHQGVSARSNAAWSKSPMLHAMDDTRAAIAGVTRKVMWTLAKL
jgi:hypothetical protein